MTMNFRSDEKSPELATAGVTGGIAIRNIDDLARLSSMLAQSGFFADAREAAQAGVKVLAGLEMGFGAFASMTGIHIIEGKPSIGAGLMAAAVKRHPKYDYRVQTLTATECVIAFYEDGERVGESSFTIEDAKRAGVPFKTRSGAPTGWEKNPRNMLFARALSNGVRWFCPDVFTTPAYTPEELGASVDGDGNVITIEHRPSPAPKAEAQAAAEPEAEETVEPPLSADDRAGPAPAEDEEPAGKGKRPRTLTGPEAQRLHAKLAAAGLPRDEHHAFASAVLAGAVVESLTQLTIAEAVEVSAIADRLARGEVEWKGGELVLPPEEDAA